ncbi:hypothetical protein M413DRAFT_412501 [Hebeloma cylindrosporum]|uniref:Arrestin-like N-terminal domain-containing protein n=1 Tax=Hebeloma cylindrosporum TaxID=76867 RepID=A0A0C2YHK4_HEBCY|nr:hypothetical protein M413DRAFT_412501 [Hebeloma cylindrosporum h7]
MALPPSYDGEPLGDWNSDPEAIPILTDLPAYAPRQRPNASALAVRREPKEFYYEMKRNGKLFASLTMISDAAYSRHMATYLEGAPLKGRVRLTLDKPDAILSVVVSVQGQFITGANEGEQLTFLHISKTLWSQSEGDPRSGNSPAGGSSSVAPSTPPKFSGKIQGDYTWPFSIDLPKEVLVPCGNRNEPQVFTLPETFNERHTRASITYDVSVRFVRTKLRADHRIAAKFGFIPIIRPPPFPPLRRLAYQEESPLLGPIGDPDGWHSMDPIKIKARTLNNRHILIDCTLFLAKPLSYTRGSVIPISLRLIGDDHQALDMLSSPKAIVARLRRRIKYHHKSVESLAWRDSLDHSQLALWWPSAEQSEQRGVRYVNGELHLRADIKPTAAMASFRIEYSVVLFSFDSPGLDLGSTEMLIEQPVNIVTAFASGPRARMYAPPGYESEIPVQEVSNVRSLADLVFF